MKKLVKILFLMALFFIVTTACNDDFLDKAPEAGLTKEEVFTKYSNFKSFFDRVYEGQNRYGNNWRDFNIKTAYPLYFAMWDQKYSWDALTDLVDQGRFMESQSIKSGSIGGILSKFVYDGDRRPIMQSMFEVIRICNLSLDNVDNIKDASADEKLDLKAQAHFVRAFAHMELFRIWGPMPYLNKALGPEDEWDIPRLSKWETCTKIAADFDSAATYFSQAKDIPLMRRDNPLQGPGHLEHPDIWRPNGCTALAYKGRILLWRASPLNNEKGVQDWQEAAVANWKAIETALAHGYFLLPFAEYKNNFIGSRNTDEALWSWSGGNYAYNNGALAFLLSGIMGESKSSFSGHCPTQNTIDKFETQWGDPLNTEADRDAAIALGHYHPQDPYKDRDPRFYEDIIYNQAPIPGYNKAHIFFDPATNKFSELLNPTYLGRSFTGYYDRKWWGGQSVKNKIQPLMSQPLIRLGEMYLNYAEAANRAYGPTGSAPGANLTALQAVNLVRSRAGMPNVQPQFTASADALEPRIHNERTVELMFEGQYYYDIRRWKTAPITMTTPLEGMYIEKLASGYDPTEYPTGYKHTRVLLSSERQVKWKDEMYYFPFLPTDMFKMSNFTPNASW